MNYPRVTEILKAVGVISGYPIDPWYAQRGSFAHKATELFDKNELDLGSVDGNIMPFLQGWIKFRDETGCEIIEIEKYVFSVKLEYQGTLDRVIKINGHLAILDLKCSKAFPPHIGQQTMAYKLAYQFGMDRVEEVKRYGLLLGDGNYRLKELKDNVKDFTGWIKSLQEFKKINKGLSPNQGANRDVPTEQAQAL